MREVCTYGEEFSRMGAGMVWGGSPRIPHGRLNHPLRRQRPMSGNAARAGGGLRLPAETAGLLAALTGRTTNGLTDVDFGGLADVGGGGAEQELEAAGLNYE